MDDPEQLGRALAESAVERMNTEGLTPSEAVKAAEADFVRQLKRLSENGENKDTVAAWTRAVWIAFYGRLDERVKAISEELNEVLQAKLPKS